MDDRGPDLSEMHSGDKTRPWLDNKIVQGLLCVRQVHQRRYLLMKQASL